MTSRIKSALVSGLLLVSIASMAGTAGTTPREDLRFSKGWKFNQGDATGAQASTYSDAAWTGDSRRTRASLFLPANSSRALLSGW